MDACKDEVVTDDEKDAEEDDEATVGDLMEAPKADINRVLARIDKALAKRSELKKEPIEKKDTGRSSKNLAYDNANAMQARSTDAGRTMNSPYGPPDMENIDGAPVSRAGFTVNNISFEPGLRYGRYNPKTHRVDAVPKGAATMIPRVEPKTVRMPDGTIENRLVPVKDKNGNVILEPMPYNGAFLLNPTEGYGNPYKFMPVYYEVVTEPVYRMKNGKQFQVGTRFKRDEFGNYVPRLDANKKIIPLKKNRNRDGELEQNYMKNPGMMRGESSFNSTGYMKDAMWIRNKFGNNAFGTTDSTTWSEIKDTLRRLQEEEIANRDKMHWLRNITRLLVDADRKSNSNEFGSHPIIDREGMGWYREDKPTYGESAFEAGVSSKPFADQAINDETSYLLPGTTPNKKFTNEKGEEQIWYPKYGKARYPFNEKSALRGRHFNDIMDALGAADNNALDEQKYNAYMEYANAKVNRKPGDELDLPPEYLGLTAQERKELINTMSSLKTLESRLESEDLLPVERAKLKKDRALLEKKRNALFRTMASRTYYDEATDTFRVGPGKLSDRQLEDYMDALNLEQTRLTERDKKEALKNNIIGARMLGTYVPRNDKTWDEQGYRAGEELPQHLVRQAFRLRQQHGRYRFDDQALPDPPEACRRGFRKDQHSASEPQRNRSRSKGGAGSRASFEADCIGFHEERAHQQGSRKPQDLCEQMAERKQGQQGDRPEGPRMAGYSGREGILQEERIHQPCRHCTDGRAFRELEQESQERHAGRCRHHRPERSLHEEAHG